MANINSVVLTGRLTADAETKEVGSTTVTNFTIASSDYMGKDKDEHCNFFNCVMFGKGGLANYLTKGMLLTISGRIKQERWENEFKNEFKKSSPWPYTRCIQNCGKTRQMLIVLCPIIGGILFIISLFN